MKLLTPHLAQPCGVTPSERIFRECLARVKDEIALKLGEIADSKGISIAKLIEEMVLESESKKGVTPDGYADRWTSRLENKFEELRERGYPERVIDDLKDQILDGLENQITRMPKNYSSRYFE